MRLTEEDRVRFHNLLRLAAESPFAGERANALAAAKRLAGRYGMTLEEAAAPEPPRPEPRRHWMGWTAPFPPDLMNDIETVLADKARREAAFRAARARGLDAEETAARRAGRGRAGPTSRERMSPLSHARILLTETSLPFRDVAQITGLDIWQVVGLKLKLRAAPTAAGAAGGGSFNQL